MKEVLRVNISRPDKVRYYSTKFFEGACADTGAQKSVCGLALARAYCRASKQVFKLHSSPYSYKLGDGIRASLGMIDVRMRIKEGFYLQFFVDVADADIPLLLGLDYTIIRQYS